VPRHFRLPLILAALGLVAVGMGIRAGSSTHQPLAKGESSTRVVTPLLSARRVPEFVARGTALRRLVATVGPMAATVKGDFCFSVAANGVQLVDHAGSEPLMPGSNMKLATAFAALEKLGAETVLHTEVAARSKPDDDGTVEGDLWFVGGGDPLIATANYVATNKYGAYPYTPLDTIADRVVEAGVRHVRGAVRGDDRRYDAKRTIESWPSRYVADNQVGPLSALSVNDAKTYAVVGAGNGSPQPSSDPPAYAAGALADLLRARGVIIDGSAATGQAPSERTTLVDMASLPVRDLVGQMLTFSDNNTAESLLKELGRSVAGEGSTKAGIDVVADVLKEEGIDAAGFVQTDGSGLDRGGRATCRALQSILTTAGSEGDLAAGLAVAGTTGTLRDRLRDSATRGQIRAKTGTLRDVTALSGWAEGRDTTDIAFAFLLNTGDRQVSAADLQAQERLVGALRSYPDAPDASTIGPLPPKAR